jgi:hypothetical protein
MKQGAERVCIIGSLRLHLWFRCWILTAESPGWGIGTWSDLPLMQVALMTLFALGGKW